MPRIYHGVPLRDAQTFQRHLAAAQHQAKRPETQVRVLKLDLDPKHPGAILRALKRHEIIFEDHN
jgi:hypothetical protein